jgi:hypothetical protein
MKYPRPLQLANLTPLTKKKRIFIFQHPDDDRILIKVMRAKEIKDTWGRRAVYKSWRRSGVYSDLLRQLEEYFLLRVNVAGLLSSISEIYGPVETDLGPGLMVEKICGPKGELAPTLKSILAGGDFSAEKERQLHLFIEDLNRYDLIVNDLNPGNIVYSEDRTEGGGFVLIDGFGDHGLIPVATLSGSIRIRNRNKRIRKLLNWLERAKAGSSKNSADAAEGGDGPVHRT